ncbi:beta-lactamase class A [Mycetocola sp. CAN_C7]|uniref:class A beta-lactamase n=1 Tax=Mycetocola sp. CAN_C7 TaxID=2787724 RepID=UPI0018CA28DB
MTIRTVRPGRVTALALASVLGVSGCSASPAPPRATPTSSPSESAIAPNVAALEADLSVLEDEYDATIGLSVIDTSDGSTLGHRAGTRFGYASTIKVLAAAALLDQTTPAELDQLITWTETDVTNAGYSPVTGEHVATGLTLGQLAEATVRTSDNAALNLVLGQLGGPTGLDGILEANGDDVTDVVHEEPALNILTPGGTADTSTPLAFSGMLAKIVSGDYLDESDQATLLDWMSGNATGNALIRAGAPDGWDVDDKSGGAGAIRNDIAVVTPPDGIPVILTIFTTRNDPAVEYDDALVAETARLALAAIAEGR